MKTRIIDGIEIEEGSGNVYADLGVPDAEEMLAKCRLCMKIEEIIKTISASANPNRKVFWGQVLDPNMGDKISVTVIATGFEQNGDGRSLDDDGSASHSNVVSMDTFDEIMGQSRATYRSTPR